MKRFVVFMLLGGLSLFPQVSTAQNVSFAPPAFFPSGGAHASAVAAGDFNGDGNLDLAVTVCDDCAQAGNVAILLGNGDGTFQAPAFFPVRYFPSYIAVGDFNHDGILDLAVVNSGNVILSLPASISILLGNGDGSFQPQAEYPVPWHPASVALGDLNEDGNLDLAIANATIDSHGSINTVTTMLGNADGTFQPPQEWSLNDAFGPLQIALGDFTGSGHLDMTVAAWGDPPFFESGGRIAFLQGNGDGTFQAPQTYNSPMLFGAIVADDFNGDGTLDILTAGRSAPDGSLTTWTALGNGDGTFQSLVPIVPDFSCFKCLVSADFNGDQNRDAAVAVTNGFAAALGKGDGSFQQPATFDAGVQPSAMAVGDFNGDGKPDVVLTTNAGADTNVAVFLNTTQ